MGGRVGGWVGDVEGGREIQVVFVPQTKKEKNLIQEDTTELTIFLLLQVYISPPLLHLQS